MELSAMFPYDRNPDDESCWELLDILRPTMIQVMSNITPTDLQRLIDFYPEIVSYHVRMKTGFRNRGSWPLEAWTWREWGSDDDPSPRMTVESLVAYGKRVCVVLGCEPDIELTAKPVDDSIKQLRAIDRYIEWATEQIYRIRRDFKDESLVGIALAPLSQGNPNRARIWQNALIGSRLYEKCQRRADHCYANDHVLEDVDWFGRFDSVFWDGVSNDLPLDILEADDNGSLWGSPPTLRAQMYAKMVIYARDHGAASICLFTLPGMKNREEEWWDLTLPIALEVRRQLDESPSEEVAVTLIKAVDVSSHNTVSRTNLGDWIGQGCRLLAVHSYHVVESPGLPAITADWVKLADSQGCWSLPYCWLFGTEDITRQVQSSLQTWRETGQTPSILFLDCETYGSPVTDPGPNVDQILEAVEVCRSENVSPVLYTGLWWLNDWLKGDGQRLAGLEAWIANYGLPPNLDFEVPFGLKLVGHQYTSKPVDWSIFSLEELTRLATHVAPPPPIDPLPIDPPPPLISTPEETLVSGMKALIADYERSKGLR